MNEFRNLPANGKTNVLGLDYKVAAILCYTPILCASLIASIMFLKTEPKSNKQLRFHAIQGLGLSMAAIGLGVINSSLMGALSIALGYYAYSLLAMGSSLIFLAFIGLCVYAIYCVYNNQEFKLPILGDIAEKNA
jgi:uncharacterized membrane protein